MGFVAVDVETANADLSSICQIGIAAFDEGKLTTSRKSLVNPEDFFDPLNVGIHGIEEEMVRFAPTWVEIFSDVVSLIHGRIVVSHTAFDRVALQRACAKASVTFCECTWLDSARVVRRAWSCFSRSGYGLANVASQLGITYVAHDALEDARCAGEILLRAVAESGLSISNWLDRVKQPIHLNSQTMSEPNPDGPLYGETLVFTGTLSITRGEAAAIAASVGCQVAETVTKRTTLLVVGDQDIRRLAGHEKSAKHRRAETLIQQGLPLRVLSETDFAQIVGSATL